MTQSVQLQITDLPAYLDSSQLAAGWFYYRDQVILKLDNGEFIRLRVSNDKAVFEEYPYKIKAANVDSLTVQSIAAVETEETTLVNKNYNLISIDGEEVALRVNNEFYSIITGALVGSYSSIQEYTRVISFTADFKYNTCGTEGPVVTLGFLTGVGYTESYNTGLIPNSQTFTYDGSYIDSTSIPSNPLASWYVEVPEDEHSSYYKITLNLDDIPAMTNSEVLYLTIGDSVNVAQLFTGSNSDFTLSWLSGETSYQVVICRPNGEGGMQVDNYQVAKGSFLTLTLQDKLLTIDGLALESVSIDLTSSLLEDTHNVLLFAASEVQQNVPSVEIKVTNIPLPLP